MTKIPKCSFGAAIVGNVALLSWVLNAPAMAACTGTAPATGGTVTCTGSGAIPVIAQASSTGVAVNMDPTFVGGFTRSVNPVAFSVDTSSTITNNGNLSLSGGGGSGGARGAVVLGVGNNNLLTATGTSVIGTTGAYNDGMAANGSGNTLINNGSITTTGPNAYGMSAAWGQTNLGQLGNSLVNTGTVSTSGSNARAASILGGNSQITNNGTLATTGAASQTVYMQGNNDHLINTGTIVSSGAVAGGVSPDAVFSNTVGSSFTALIENRAGGQIISQNGAGIRSLNGDTTVINAGLIQSGVGTAIKMGNGNNSLILQTGSVINGAADGGAGTNGVTLQGSGLASNAFTNFQTLLMQGTLWTWSGSGTFASAHLQTGTLDLTGTLGASTSALVDAGATLQAGAQNMPQSVADNGWVRFVQTSPGTYSGQITGAGSLEKTGAQTLVLAPVAGSANTYSGGTSIQQGALAVGTDNALGAATGGITLNGGALQLLQSFDLAGSRTVVLGAAGGTIDTQAFASTLMQPVTGSGALTKMGGGSLLMTGVSTYTGATTVMAGTLAVGDAAHGNAALAGGGAVSVASGASLGGYGSVNAAVTNNGTIAAANALPMLAQAVNGGFTINGSLTNAGLVQIGGTGVGNQLQVVGSYMGQSGVIGLNTQLAGDGAASDRLVINAGTVSGTTSLKIANVGGLGAQTLGDGIQVIQMLNGASSPASAFTLAAPVKAGAYQYYLAQGGVTAGSSNNWYLRNTVAPLPIPVTNPPQGSSTPSPTQMSGIPVPAAGTPSLPAAPGASSAPIALYRTEVPMYAETPSVARQLGIFQVDTFHDRQGEQSLLHEEGNFPAAWARTWGGHSVMEQNGTVNPQFSGEFMGLQVGRDVYAQTSASGHRNRYGLFFGYAKASGDVDGLAMGTPHMKAGHLAIDSYSLGGYWTRVGLHGGYTDAVVMGSALDINPLSKDGLGATTPASALLGSIETGFPITLSDRLVLEPQAQLLAQHLSINDLNDGASSLSFNRGDTFVARIAARLSGRFDTAGATWQSYVRLGMLRNFGTDDQATFSGTTVIDTGAGQTLAKMDAGVFAKLGRSHSIYAAFSWRTSMDGAYVRTVTGNLGMRWVW